LENLVSNALKFTTHGFVDVTLTPDTMVDGRPAIHLQVRDTGPGIAESELDAIFEEFYRVADRRAVAGTGLGLAIARRLVERHGGRIWAESVLGQGSVFHLLLPETAV
jgi:signal transduction histidine kinase